MSHVDKSIDSAGQLQELTETEAQLIAAVRNAAGHESFSITIRKQPEGRFFVSRSMEARNPSLGSGTSFEEAWTASN